MCPQGTSHHIALCFNAGQPKQRPYAQFKVLHQYRTRDSAVKKIISYNNNHRHCCGKVNQNHLKQIFRITLRTYVRILYLGSFSAAHKPASDAGTRQKSRARTVKTVPPVCVANWCASLNSDARAPPPLHWENFCS